MSKKCAVKRVSPLTESDERECLVSLWDNETEFDGKSTLMQVAHGPETKLQKLWSEMGRTDDLSVREFVKAFNKIHHLSWKAFRLTPLNLECSSYLWAVLSNKEQLEAFALDAIKTKRGSVKIPFRIITVTGELLFTELITKKRWDRWTSWMDTDEWEESVPPAPEPPGVDPENWALNPWTQMQMEKWKEKSALAEYRAIAEDAKSNDEFFDRLRRLDLRWSVGHFSSKPGFYFIASRYGDLRLDQNSPETGKSGDVVFIKAETPSELGVRQ